MVRVQDLIDTLTGFQEQFGNAEVDFLFDSDSLTLDEVHDAYFMDGTTVCEIRLEDV